MKKKTLLTSILTMIMCLSLIVGGTFALFTSESNVDMTITSGKVSITAAIDETSVETKKLYEDYTAGDNNMFGGVASFDQEGLTLKNFVPGDGVKFNIVVKNDSSVAIKYRTVISCQDDDGLFAGLNVNIADRQNYNGNKYVTNWQTLQVESDDIVVPVSIELPGLDIPQNQYQSKTCKIVYFVEAYQGNAKTENVSSTVAVDGNATQSATLATNGPDSPVVEASADALNFVAPDANGGIALMHSEPVIEGNTVSFRTMEIVNADGEVMDLSGNTGKFKVTFSVKGSSLNVGDEVYVYHDNEHIATCVVDTDYNITYETTHFCEVTVSTDVLSDTIKVDDYEEFKAVLAKAEKAKRDITIVLDSDIAFTKKLELQKGIKLTIDLNGYDIDANLSSSVLFELQDKTCNALTITSSKPYARINVGGNALVLAYADVVIENVEIVVGEIKSSSYQTIKMQKGNLTVKNAEFNVSFLGTSLISGATTVVIEDTALWINTFKTNAGAIISNNASTQVILKNVSGNISLDATYSQYLVMRNANNVTMENFNATIKDKDGAIYEIVTIENESVNDRVGFAKVIVADILSALANGEDVNVNANLTINAGLSNAYGATGLNIYGGTFDMNGKTLRVTNAGGTWDSAINITKGAIKNVKITSGFRGIFINHNNATQGKVYLENVIIDGTIYTISCDQGTNSGLEAVNSTFNGWTSYADTLGNAKFIGCSFGYGAGYSFSRPYAPTEYVNCNFEAGYEIDAAATITFENCTFNGAPITADNLAELVISNVANATVIA